MGPVGATLIKLTLSLPLFIQSPPPSSNRGFCFSDSMHFAATYHLLYPLQSCLWCEVSFYLYPLSFFSNSIFLLLSCFISSLCEHHLLPPPPLLPLSSLL